MKKHDANTEKAVSTTTNNFEVPQGFPAGLKISEAPSATGTHEIVWGSIMYGKKEVRVNLIRALNAPEDGEFLPAAVFVGQKKVWTFKRETEEGFRGFAFIRQVAGEVIILLTDFDNKIVKVIPLYDFVSQVEISVAGKIRILGRRSAEKLYDLKMAAHKEFKLRYYITLEEAKIRDARIEAEKAKKEEKRLAAEEARKAKLEQILKRSEVVVYTLEKKLFGLPVTSAEWEMLPSGTKVILVADYNEAEKTIGDPIEAFFVEKGKKPGSRPRKAKVFTGLSWKRPKPKEDEPLEAIGFILLDIGRGPEEICHLSESGMEELKKRGVNNGTIVAVGDYSAEGNVRVVSLENEKVKTLGHFTPLEK